MKKKVLLLDDNMSVCKSSIDELCSAFDVVKCRQIRVAAHKLTVYKFNLMVIDLMMPPEGLDVKDEFNAGFFFYKQYIKGKYDEVPVLFWTNLNETPYMEFMKENGGNSQLHYLQKSDDREELVNKVKEILNK